MSEQDTTKIRVSVQQPGSDRKEDIGSVRKSVLFLLCAVLTFLCVSLVHAVTARLRIEQLFKYYWTVVAGLAFISLVLAWYGL